jgi:hypothetical protein
MDLIALAREFAGRSLVNSANVAVVSQRHSEAVSEAAFDAAAVVSGVGLSEERRAQDTAYGGDVEMIQDVGAADVGGECLRVFGFDVAREFEGALEIGVEIEGPGHGACVALECASGAGCGE